MNVGSHLPKVSSRNGIPQISKGETRVGFKGDSLFIENRNWRKFMSEMWPSENIHLVAYAKKGHKHNCQKQFQQS